MGVVVYIVFWPSEMNIYVCENRRIYAHNLNSKKSYTFFHSKSLSKIANQMIKTIKRLLNFLQGAEKPNDPLLQTCIEFYY